MTSSTMAIVSASAFPQIIPWKLSLDFILHGPDVIHGCDRYGVLCGVITKFHGASNLSYAWFRNGKPFISGPHLAIIPVTEAGEYSCTITKEDSVAISDKFVYGGTAPSGTGTSIPGQAQVCQKRKKATGGEPSGTGTSTSGQTAQKRMKSSGEEPSGTDTSTSGQAARKQKAASGEEASGTDTSTSGQAARKQKAASGEEPCGTDTSTSGQAARKQKAASADLSQPANVEYPFRLIAEEEITFNKDDVIGRGSFGIVYKGEWAGTPVAIKVISTRHLLQNPKRLLQEATIHSSLNHPNILQLMGACLKERQLYILTPYIHGSNLDNLIFSEEGSERKMDRDLKGYVAWQAASAVAYLHNLKPPVIHQDIKPANFILEDLTNSVRLMNLGLARLRNAVSTSQGGLTPCGGGTPMYSAPEVIVLGEPAREPADVWGLGCTILELVVGAPVWEGMKGDDDCDNFLLPIMGRKEKPQILNKLDVDYAFIADCFTYNRGDRPSSIRLVGNLKGLFSNEKFLGFRL